MMEEENVIKDIRNLFRLKKELNYTAIKDIRDFYRLEKQTKEVRDIKILRDTYRYKESFREGKRRRKLL